MKVIRFCSKYILQYKFNFVIYIILVFSVTCMSVVFPYVIGTFIDILTRGAHFDDILNFSIVIASLNLLKIIIQYIITVLYTNIRLNASHALNKSIIIHIQNLSLSYSNDKDNTYLTQRINNDSNNLIVFCISVSQNIISNLIMLIFPFIVMINANKIIAIFMLGFVLMYFIAYLSLKGPFYKSSLASSEAQATFVSSLFEQLKYIKHIKINSLQLIMHKRLNEKFLNLKKAAFYSQKIGYIYSSWDNLISTFAQIFLFIYGGLQVSEGNFTIGIFAIFTIYFNMMLSSGKYFSDIGASYRQALVSYDRIKEILDYTPESIGIYDLEKVNKIQFEDLSFSYSGENTLNKINKTFTKGNLYAISGNNGTGKTTFINLMIGLYIDEYIGKITYNDINIRNLNMINIRKKHLGFAEQEPLLLSGSIYFNLFFDNVDFIDNINDKHLDFCLDVLNMNEFIYNLGLDYMINEKNTNVSGGEKQKIAILKVLLKNSDIMIFDEPTSALDLQTTKKFIKYLNEIKKDKIIIIISHDEFIKNNGDEIFDIEKLNEIK
ncbi:MAG: ABC transporter ATP-binding protein/permease [Defluviitaleaceae bacterium]|nr:ABC transporter ATP-binding protein/permease [Defluviitaleaceae bacterium]